MEIVLDSPRVSGSSIEYRLHVSRPLRKYFLGSSFYVHYGSGVDLQDVDAGILSIPMVALIAPIAWAVGVDVVLPEIDASYMRSLEKVKDPYRSLHPSFSFSGHIRAGRETTSQFEGSGTCMLFTGGGERDYESVRGKQNLHALHRWSGFSYFVSASQAQETGPSLCMGSSRCSPLPRGIREHNVDECRPFRQFG